MSQLWALLPLSATVLFPLARLASKREQRRQRRRAILIKRNYPLSKWKQTAWAAQTASAVAFFRTGLTLNGNGSLSGNVSLSPLLFALLCPPFSSERVGKGDTSLHSLVLCSNSESTLALESRANT